MKNKTLILALSFYFCANSISTHTLGIASNYKIESVLPIPIKTVTIKKQVEYTVTVTMYNPTSSQCDDSPLVTADGSKINPNHASEQKLIALSRDLLKHFKYGDMVKIKGTGGSLPTLIILRG